jgi:hypothetical protein
MAFPIMVLFFDFYEFSEWLRSDSINININNNNNFIIYKAPLLVLKALDYKILIKKLKRNVLC